MKLSRCLIVLFGLLYAATASANVIYRWETLTTSPTIWSVTGEIEFADSAWEAGSVSYRAPPWVCGSCPNNNDPLSPVLYVYIHVNGPTIPSFFSIPLTRLPRYDLSVNVDFSSPSSVTGSMQGLEFDAEFSMSSGARQVWTIGKYMTDYGCGFGDYSKNYCYGATGYWRRVPEPPSLLLLVIGLLSLMSKRQRKA